MASATACESWESMLRWIAPRRLPGALDNTIIRLIRVGKGQRSRIRGTNGPLTSLLSLVRDFASSSTPQQTTPAHTAIRRRWHPAAIPKIVFFLSFRYKRMGKLSAAVVGVIAAAVAVLLGIVAVYKTHVQPARRVALAAPLALVDLQPEPAEESLKPIDFQRNKLAIVHSSQRFTACVDSAATVDEGVWCMGQLLSVLPRPLEKRALEVAKEVYPSKHVVGDPKILAMKLESCVAHASERDGAVFCLSDLLSHVPPAVVNRAVELAEQHPAFDWQDGHAAAVHDATVFNTCVDTARNVGEGVKCLGTLLSALPHALVERSVRITSELPAPHQPAEEPQMLSKDFVYCLEIAETRDAATYCLAHFLGRLPDEQV